MLKCATYFLQIMTKTYYIIFKRSVVYHLMKFGFLNDIWKHKKLGVLFSVVYTHPIYFQVHTPYIRAHRITHGLITYVLWVAYILITYQCTFSYLQLISVYFQLHTVCISVLPNTYSLYQWTFNYIQPISMHFQLHKPISVNFQLHTAYINALSIT